MLASKPVFCCLSHLILVHAAVNGTALAGCITLCGRADDTIVLSSGLNIQPGPIEDAITTSHFVTHAIVWGEGCRMLGALIVPDKQALAELENARGELFRFLLGHQDEWRVHGLSFELSTFEELRRIGAACCVSCAGAWQVALVFVFVCDMAKDLTKSNYKANQGQLL